MKIEAYLFFEGRCEEAIAFYREATGAETLMQMRYRESPEPPGPGCELPPGSEDRIMHASLKIGDSVVMMSDGMCSGRPSFAGFSLSLTAPDPAAARRLFDALAAGGEVQMPLAATFWSPCFGMLRDRFGVGWMVGVEGQ